MDTRRVVLLIESDEKARAQMRRVLEELDVEVKEALEPDQAYRIASTLQREGRYPELMVARVTLPEGNGVQVVNDLAAMFPSARKLLVSHYSKSLLFSLPGFANCSAEFLQAEFSDEKFRRCAERALARRLSA